MESYFQNHIYIYFGSLVIWGYLMAFLYNLVGKSSSPKGDTTVMQIALILFLSYLLTDLSLHNAFDFELAKGFKLYLMWGIFDFVTILVVLAVSFYKLPESLPVKHYVIFGLTANMFMYFAMYVDTEYLQHYQHWWFWDTYRVTTNFMDIMILVALFVNKDFLGLIRLYKWLRGQNKKASLE